MQPIILQTAIRGIDKHTEKILIFFTFGRAEKISVNILILMTTFHIQLQQSENMKDNFQSLNEYFYSLEIVKI